MSSDAYAEAASDGDTGVIPRATTADAVEQRQPAVPADAADPALPVELPDAVDPADALDQSRTVDELDDDR